MTGFFPDTKVVEMKGITKTFGDFTALDCVDLTVHRGEIHALLGENGAGKSTLMNILYGLYSPTAGEIYIRGERCDMENPKTAIGKGIGMVHQHFMLVRPFTVAENIVLGIEPTKFPGTLDMRRATDEVKVISRKYGLYVDPGAKIQDISVGMEQRVEIIKALVRGADILILDEPTAVLTPGEIEELMQIVRNLAGEGKSVILISHKLKEIKKVADRCTIIRRGALVDTVEVSSTSEEDLAAKMVGRKVSFRVEKAEREAGDAVLEIENLIVKDNRGIPTVRNLSLKVRAGEILGIAGIDGNGQSELVEAIAGLRKVESGRILMKGRDLTGSSPSRIIDSGVSHIPEDRQKRGLVLDFTVAENMILESHGKPPFAAKGILNRTAVTEFSRDLIERFDVNPPDGTQVARNLSGGNQQKVVIAREFSGDPELLIASQPTRGLDVGAIEYVHRALVDRRDYGKAVLLVSFDLDEVMNVADRIAVIYEGEIVGVMDSDEVDIETLGLMMAGGR